MRPVRDDVQTPAWQILTGVIALAFIVIIAAMLLLVTQPDPVQITINPPVPTATPQPSATPGPIVVYVTGAVNAPQTTVALPAGSRVGDALLAAGGTTADADLTLVNVAALVRDGDQVHVPAMNGAPAQTAPLILPTRSGGAVVFVNTATVEELETLPRIGPAIAARIVAYRDENGPYLSLEDLGNVNGIGPATLEQLAPLVTFD